ncbi:LysR family transcriptional regulator [uncultured Cohaesibacter sp.]|uniref:LysR family transcriptional regulator n=1 Tax=uncultured Cohaesibacter sp. TaxID=1002546 RepID=UPI0029C747FF|nr:LysR family transcriptional regulator [uncultured Cohaesibacter sp.]
MATLRSLHVFDSICLFGSITEASQQINLSQPAMTQSLNKLETALGVSLFQRGKGMTCTEAGTVFHRRTRSGMNHLQQAVLQAAGRTAKDNPHLYRQISNSHLSCLQAVFEAGSFKQAAQGLGLTLSTVHRTFRSLEALLDINLADTRPNSVRRNAAGEAFYTLSKLAAREFRQATSDLEGWKGNYEESFTVGALPLVQSSILPKALIAFSQEFPHVTVVVVDGIYNSLLRQMKRGEIDYIIGALREGEQSEMIEQTPLFDDTLIVVGRVGHPVSKLKKVTERDLAAYPWVMPRKGSPSRGYFDAFYADLKRPSRLQCPIETGSFSVLRGLLQQSDRLSTISAQQARYELDNNLLTQIDYPLQQSARRIGYANRAGWQPSLPQRRFLQLLG